MLYAVRRGDDGLSPNLKRVQLFVLSTFCLGSLIILSIAAAWGDRFVLWEALAVCAASAVAFVLGRKEYTDNALALPLCVVAGCVFLSCYLYRGIDDVGASLIPVLILIAGLLLNRRFVFAYTTVVILGAIGVMAGRWWVTRVRAFDPSEARDLLLFVLVCALSAIITIQLEERIGQSYRLTRESERRFEDLAEQSRTTNWQVDTQGLFTYVSRVSEASWGYPPDEVVGRMHFYDLHPEAGREAFKTAVSEVTGRMLPFQDVVHAVETKDDRVVWGSTSGIPMLDADGTLRGYQGSCTDITERKLTEEKLVAVMKAVESTSDAVGISDAQGRHYYQNAALSNLFEYATAEELEAAGGEPALIKDAQVAREMSKAITSGNSWVGELEMVTKSGRVFPAYERADAIRDNQGRTIGRVGIITDITARKRVEEELRKNEHLLSQSQRIAHIGTWSLDLTSQSLVWTDETYAIYGVSSDMFTPSVESLIGLIHSDDRRSMEEWIGATAAGHSAGHLEFRALRPDGSIRILSGQGEMVFSVDTRTALMIGTVQDITERKRGEEALKEINLLNQVELAVQESLATQTSLPAALQECCAVLVRALDGAFARIWTLSQDGTVLDLQASAGLYTHIDGSHRQIPVGQYKIGRIAAEKQPLLTNNVIGDPAVHDQDWAKKESMVGFAGYPLLVEDRVLGVMAMFSRHRLPDVALRGLALVASRISVSIERKRAEEERKNLHAQLAQSQKMESIGRLAGGIAHDFSNLMSVILLHDDSALQELRSGDRLVEPLTEIRKAAERAVAMTQQLMAFSRKRVLQTEVLNLNSVIVEYEKLVRPVIGEDIHLVFIPGSELGLVKADRGQLGQIIMNLVVNSRDAMPHGGTLTLETASVELDEVDAHANPEAKPGSYVMLAVRDTGVGMDQKTQARIFEPFFTTKEVGKGTGLGLSMVYGIVNQSGGCVTVHSKEGHGTEFQIYLPRVLETPEPVVAIEVAPGQRGIETILVVEDEPALREPLCRILEVEGYRVLVGKDVDEAIQIATQHNGPLDLLLTDVVMPRMSGPQMAEHLRPLYPQMKVLYMSGYPEPRQPGTALGPEVDFIQKPFTKQKLLSRLREVLAGGYS